MSGLRAIVSDVRKRLFPILIAFAIGAIASFQIMDGVLQQIIEHTKPAGASIVYLTPLEVIMLKLKMAMICGVLLAILAVIYFVYRSIRRSARGRGGVAVGISSIVTAVVFAAILFVSGVLYAYFLIPLFLSYLYQNAASTGAVATYSISEFVSFVIMIATVFGISFELPLVMTILVRSGLVRYRSLIDYRRHAYIGLLIAAALFTPPDVLSQIIVALPLAILYEISIFVVRFTGGVHSDSA